MTLNPKEMHTIHN